MALFTVQPSSVSQVWQVINMGGGIAQDRLRPAWARWNEATQTLFSTLSRHGVHEREGRAVLRTLALAVDGLMRAQAGVPAILSRLNDASDRVEPAHRAWVQSRALRAMLLTPEHRERVLRVLDRSPQDRSMTRLTIQAIDLPLIGRRLVADVRFWRVVGMDPYNRWARILDDPRLEAQRAWEHLERADQEVLSSTRRSAEGIAHLMPLARWRVNTVRAMEQAPWLTSETDRPWARRWLLTAIEWGSLERVRAAVNVGLRLNDAPLYEAYELLKTVLNGAFFGPAPTNEPHALEQVKGSVWALVVQAGLPRVVMAGHDPANAATRGQGNGAVWRQEILRGHAWGPVAAHAFARLALYGWDDAHADGLAPLDWAVQHGATVGLWSPAVVMGVLHTIDVSVYDRLDGLLLALDQVGVRWTGEDASHDGLVVQAVHRGATPMGLTVLARMGADFAWSGPANETVVMGLLADTRVASRWPLVRAVLDLAIGHRGDAALDLLTRTDREGATVLHWAARALDEESVHGLVQRGLDATVLDRKGRNPVHWVARRGREARGPQVLGVVRALQAYGVDLYSPTANGTSALADLLTAAPVTILEALVRPVIGRLFAPEPNGRSWHQALTERRANDRPVNVIPVLETLELLHAADQAMPPEGGRPVRGLRRL